MKYYIDTEFYEYKKQPKVLGLNIGEPIDTIELISIGIVAEDGREYYSICNEFDLKAAWDNEWLKENVLKPIFHEFLEKEKEKAYIYKAKQCNVAISSEVKDKFCIRLFKRYLNKYGKTREQIADEIERFVYAPEQVRPTGTEEPIDFYAYYADYDWVVFCWLFGRMIDLPKGFPMYCKDLKQELDEKQNNRLQLKKTIEETKALEKHEEHRLVYPLYLKEHINYPKQENEHNALADAKWNKRLHEFIKGL